MKVELTYLGKNVLELRHSEARNFKRSKAQKLRSSQAQEFRSSKFESLGVRESSCREVRKIVR